MNISFTVYATPESQGSIRSFLLPDKEFIEQTAFEIVGSKLTRERIIELLTAVAKKTRSILTSDNPDLKKYRAKVARAAKDAMKGQEIAEKHSPVEIHLEFIFLKPKSVSSKRHYPVVKPDIDKLVRSVLDSCTAIVWNDDAEVVDVRASKRYGPQECVNVKAWTIDDVPTTGFLPLVAQQAPKINEW